MSDNRYIINQWDSNYSHCNFFHFHDVFNRREVKEIIQYGEALSLVESRLEANNVDTSYHRSLNSWINQDDDTAWIYERIKEVAMMANNHFRFDISHFGEPIQFTKYKEGGLYKWHEDIGGGKSSIRKLSVVINLSDPRSYTGGELQIFSSRNEKINNSLGGAIVFPSFKEHRVTPVKSGTRYSLVSWVSGPRFR